MSKQPRPLQRAIALLNALREANTVVYTELRRGDYFVLIVPTWQGGSLYYRLVRWTPFHARAGLPVMSNLFMSARYGMRAIFDAARSELIS